MSDPSFKMKGKLIDRARDYITPLPQIVYTPYPECGPIIGLVKGLGNARLVRSICYQCDITPSVAEGDLPDASYIKVALYNKYTVLCKLTTKSGLEWALIRTIKAQAW